MSKMSALHCHSEWSPMDGACSTEEMIIRAKELDLPAISITDHGTLAGHREFQRMGKQYDQKIILGEELYYSETDRYDRRAKASREDGTSTYVHLIALAQNDRGLKNLQALDREAWLSYHYKPRMDFELLEQYNEDIIFTSGCMGGLLSKAFERDDEAYAYEQATKFKELLGDRYYVELQSHNPIELNHKLLKLADDLNIKPILSEDSHHAWPHQKELQEIFLILSTSPKKDFSANVELAQKMPMLERLNYLYPDRKMTFQHLDIFIAGYDHRKQEMLKQGIERDDIFGNTLEISDRIEDYTYLENLTTLPDLADNVNETLREKVFAGLKKKGLDNKPEYVDQANFELKVIEDKKFSNYFLVLEDVMSWIRKQKIRYGLGRGSAAGSLVCFAVDITGIDPIKESLLFERFLDPSRPDFPDADLDIQKSRREEVKQYLKKRHGHVANITNVLRYQGKAALKAAARAIGVPYAETEKAMKVLKGMDELTGLDAIEEFRSSKGAQEFIKKYPDVIPIAKQLKGMISGYGMHAAGIVIADKPLSEYAPIETRKIKDSDERAEVVAFDYRECEKIGLIKIDFLGLSTLDVVDDAVRFIRENKGIRVDIDALDFNDQRVFDMIATGKTLGVFQLEQPASAKLSARIAPKSFDDLVAINALVRPGAWDAIGEDFIAIRNGKKKPLKIHDDVSYFMDSTYNLPVFQEQLMKLCVDLANMSTEQANKVRKGLGKKIRSIIDEYKPMFVAGASEKVDKKVAEKLWHSFEAAGAYMFNKSHSVAYSVLIYQTAWLKVLYPLEFMCAVLKNEEERDSVTDYLLDCKQNGIKVKLPHINFSQKQFSIEDDGLRMGLEGVKYISEKVSSKIIDYRPYENYEQFFNKVKEKGSGLNVRVLQSLNAFGGAAFEDNPVPADYKSNLYEVLGIPAFETNMVTSMMKANMRTLDEYTADETFIVMAMVKNIKSGNGWSRIDMVDSTGSESAFAGQDSQILKGKMYIFLIGNNRVMKHIDLADQNGESEDIIIDYLRRPVLSEIGEDQFKILHAEARKTRAGDDMAYLVVTDGYKNLKTVMVFKSMFRQVRAACPIGSVKYLKLAELKDGGYCVNGVS